MTIPFIEDNDQTRARHEHLVAIRELVGNVYPSKFERSHITGSEDTITSIVRNTKFTDVAPKMSDDKMPEPEEVKQSNSALNKPEVRIGGRVATPPRVMGKAAFVHLSDGVSRLQIYIRKSDVIAVRNDGNGTADGWTLFNLLDHGDFIGVRGYLFFTKTGELSVHVQELHFLAKALLPMPDKMHGISDPEIRRRQRYAELIAESLKVEQEEGELTTRQVIERRAKLIGEMRRFLDGHGYVEVETPMLTPKATGAAAKPFKTHHNALDIDLYARIAPELYLKRLTVGGFERVYELNRNFRNEGISTRHNPEFTMLEFYCAYMDVNGMMDFCEEMVRTVVEKVVGSTLVSFGVQGPPLERLSKYRGVTRRLYRVDFESKFLRLTMKDAIRKYWYENKDIVLGDYELDGEEFTLDWFENPRRIRFLADFVQNIEEYKSKAEDTLINDELLSIEEVESEDHEEVVEREMWRLALHEARKRYDQEDEPDEEETARNIANLFEALAEPHLEQPTFIIDFPKVISPLSKASPNRPSVAERFELFASKMEIANGFSELNDPEEQYERFLEQTRQRDRGDEEAMVMDEDYIRALSYGMPPAAGIGIGIDRLVMILTGKLSIRDVILFPHMRPEGKAGKGTKVKLTEVEVQGEK